MMLPYELTGNNKSNILVIFLHGFPDSLRLWDQTIQGIETSDVQILNISYPNYHESQQYALGLDLSEIVKRLKNTIDFIDQGKQYKKLMVTHDWGSFFGYYYDLQYPQAINDMIALDIGGQMDPKGKEKLLILSYQLTFAFAYLLTLIPIVGQFFGTLLSTLYMRIFWRTKPPQNYSATINYPYFYLYLNYALSKLNLRKRFLSGYKPSVSVVYIYGQKKPFSFHSARWQLTLSENKDSEFIGVNTGHWIQREQPQIVIDKILQRIAKLAK